MTLPAGTRLGPYEILSPLGAGGMGEVYRARDTKLEREVAVKVLPASVARDPDTLSRFEREAKAIAALSHPNILAIHDFGNHEGVAYAVTELLEGEPLRARLQRGPMPAKEATDCAVQIAKGLAAAHDKGIVHRDLKPENLFVTRDGHVKILDFGLVKRIEPAAPDDVTSTSADSVHTEVGAVMGTVGYMSPEQVRGLPADPRSDIFSFGAILYEMLSGKRAFRHETAGDTMAAILRDDPPELSASGGSVSETLDRVVRRCMAKGRSDRFQSAKDVVFALSVASSSSSSSPGLSSATHSALASRGRKRVLAWTTAAAIALTLAGAGVALLRRTPARGPEEPPGGKRMAVLPFENLGPSEDDYFADGVSDEVRGKLTSMPGIQVIARGSSTPYRKTSKTPKQIAEELNVSYLLTATVRWEKVGGQSRVHVSPELVDVTRRDAPVSRWQQSFDAALTDVFQVQSDIATHVAQALGVALGAGEERRLSEKPTQNLAAYDAFLKGEEAADSLGAIDPVRVRKALGLYEEAVALDPGFVLAWSRLSQAASSRFGVAVPTPEMAQRAKEAAEKAVALAPNRPEGYAARGTYLRMVANDNRLALEEYTRGRRIAPDNADLLRGTALAEEELGRWEDAVVHFRQAERLDPRSVTLWTSTGSALLRLRRYPEAREAVERGLAIAPANLRLIENRAMTYLGEGDLAGARSALKAASPAVAPAALVAYLANYNDLVWVLDEPQRALLVRLTPADFDDDRPTWAMALAEVYALAGDAPRVRQFAEEARRGFADQVRVVPDDAGRRISLALALAYLGRREEALREGEAGAALAPVAKQARTGPYYQHQLVRIAVLVGEHEQAIDRLDALLKVPYYLSPAWLRIDPNFDPLRKNPRFEKLVATANSRGR